MSDQPPANADVPPDVSQPYDADLANPPAERELAAISAAELKSGAQQRSQQRPLLQKILAVFRKEKGSYRELIINCEPLEKRVALLVDGRLEKFEIERESDNRMVGGIFKGRIKNLDPGLKAAFVDIGYAKNAFLHYWDMLPAATDSSVEVVRVNRKKDAQPKGEVMIQFGTGKVDFAAVYAELKKAGFNGPTFVECAGGKTFEEVTQSARANRIFLEKIFAAL